MSAAIDSPITWRSVIRLGLAWAAEYAVLALIEDAPAALKIATVLCAVAGLFVLETENWLRQQQKYLFIGLITLISAVYACFVIYAVNHAMERVAIRNGLQHIYSEATPLIERHISVSRKNDMMLDQDEVATFKNDYHSWENKSAKWMLDNLGEAAHDHFLDQSNITIYMSFGDRIDNDYDRIRNVLAVERKNIIAIMESRVYSD